MRDLTGETFGRLRGVAAYESTAREMHGEFYYNKDVRA